MLNTSTNQIIIKILVFSEHDANNVLDYIDMTTCIYMYCIDNTMYVQCCKISKFFVRTLETGRKTSFSIPYCSECKLILLSCNVKKPKSTAKLSNKT